MPRLSREDFIVVEGGERRPIVGFNAEADGPVKVAVLFDISGSMRVGTKAVDAQQAARHLFSSLKQGDEAALFAFDTELEKVTDFTTDFKGLESKVDKVEPPFGQTSLFDAIAETAKAVADAAGSKGQGSAALGDCGPDRRHRYEEPVDRAGSFGHRQQHRRAGLHRRRDVTRGRPAESGLRHGGPEQRPDGSGAMDGRRLLHRDLAGAREHRGAADCRGDAEPVHARVRSIRESRLEIVGSAGAGSGTRRARAKWVYRGGWVAIPGRGAATVTSGRGESA